jgi:hypothetical protein
MLRRFKHTSPLGRVVVSLPCAAVLFAAFAGATLIPQRAWSADLRLPKPVVHQETPQDRRQRLFEEFLRYLRTQIQ